VLKNLQYGLGFLIGFLAVLIVGIGAVVAIEAVIGSALPFKVLLVLVPSMVSGYFVSRWIGGMDLASMFPERPKTPPPPAHPAPVRKRQRRPWSFHLVGTLSLFWFLSLVTIIVLFGPFGFENDFSTPIRLLKIGATTIVIAGLGAFLLRKELMKLMSGPAK
jgi:hypothetical protein